MVVLWSRGTGRAFTTATPEVVTTDRWFDRRLFCVDFCDGFNLVDPFSEQWQTTERVSCKKLKKKKISVSTYILKNVRN